MGVDAPTQVPQLESTNQKRCDPTFIQPVQELLLEMAPHSVHDAVSVGRVIRVECVRTKVAVKHTNACRSYNEVKTLDTNKRGPMRTQTMTQAAAKSTWLESRSCCGNR